MVQLLAYYRGNTLETFLSKFPVKEFEDDSEFTWDVIGSAKRNIPLVEARTLDNTVIEDGDDMIGAGTEPFYLVFAEDWFADGEVIFGNLNEVYPMRILGDPRLEGSNVVKKLYATYYSNIIIKLGKIGEILHITDNTELTQLII